MHRRIVALLLLPCVVLPQSGAAFGHAHGGHEPASHALRPHFHTSHNSVHGHVAHRHRDRHDHRVEYGFAAEHSRRGGNAGPLSQHEHDSDAIYVNHVDIVVRPRTAASDVIGEMSLSLFGIAEPQSSAALLVGLRPCVVGSSHPPPCGSYDCPLYLWQRALLI